jgi:hypothetical protein
VRDLPTISFLAATAATAWAAPSEDWWSIGIGLRSRLESRMELSEGGALFSSLFKLKK